MISKFQNKNRIQSKTKNYILSLFVLLITSIISSLGGLSFQGIESIITKVLPIIVIFPSLNDLMGNFAIVFSSKFSTWLYEGKIKEKYAFDNKEMKRLLREISIAGFQFSAIISFFGIFISAIVEHQLNIVSSLKVFLISVAVVEILILFLFIIISVLGLYLFKKNKDPDEILIPLSTSLADFLTMVYVASFVLLLF